MSRWNQPMRRYRPATVLCAGCGKPIVPQAEFRMLGREAFHVLCAPRREATA